MPTLTPFSPRFRPLLRVLALALGLFLSLVLSSGAASAATPARPVRPPQRVVFIHGIFQDGNLAFGNLRHRLEARGVECFAPTLRPADCRAGLDELAQQLQRHIDQRWGPRAHFSMVGFSMGALVGRYYLQEMNGARRCDELITVSCPHQGTLLAWCHPGKGARQMRPGSDFLKQLAATEDRLGAMPLASYRTPYDWVVLPTRNAIWARAEENRRFPVLGHVFMTKDRRVVEAIETRLMGSPSVSPAVPKPPRKPMRYRSIGGA